MKPFLCSTYVKLTLHIPVCLLMTYFYVCCVSVFSVLYFEGFIMKFAMPKVWGDTCVEPSKTIQ